VIRICNGDMPGQKKIIGADYEPVICAYNYIKGKLFTYKVIGFDLVFKNENDASIRIIRSKGNYFNSEMKSLLVNIDSVTIKYLFLDNVELISNDKDTIVIKGLKPLMTAKNGS